MTLRGFFTNPWVRWALSLLILGAILFFLREHLDFLSKGIQEIRNASLLGVGLTFLALVLSMLAMAEVMRILLRAGGLNPARAATAALTFASNSWSATFPGGPALSAVLTFHVQRSWGASVILCSWFFVLSSALSTMWLVALGISAIFFMGAALSLWSLLLSFLLMVGLSGLVYWAANNPDTMESWARDLLPRVNHLLRKPEQRGVDKLMEHIGQLRTVTLTAPKFGMAAGWSLLNRLFDAMSLWLCIWAVTGELPWLEAAPDTTTLAGVILAYTTAKIVGSIQATPGGIGPVEAAYITALVATGMTAVDAAGAVIIYRLISFLLMALIGWGIYFIYFTPRGLKARNAMEIDGTKPDSMGGHSSTAERPAPGTATESAPERYQK